MNNSYDVLDRIQNLTDRVGSPPFLKLKGTMCEDFNFENEAWSQDAATPFQRGEWVAQKALPRKPREAITKTRLKMMR